MTREERLNIVEKRVSECVSYLLVEYDLMDVEVMGILDKIKLDIFLEYGEK